VAGGLALAGALLSVGIPESLAALTVEDVVGERTGKETVSYPIPAADGAQIDRKNQVILVRWQGTAYAFALSCPHQNTALRWIEKDGRFQCPKHKSRYTPDGTFISGRATRGMDRYSVRLESGQLVVDVGALHEQDKDPRGWTAATAKVA
jgi:Rieske Fe-S protein